MAWVSKTAVIAAALILAAQRGEAREYSYEPGERSDPWGGSSVFTDPHWLVDHRTGCMAYDSNAGASDTIAWSGTCPFGRADGHGTLTFYDHGRIFEQLTGSFDAGVLEDGRVSITWADGSHYDGEEKNGQFNGYGVLTNGDGTRYDGLWQDDKFVNAKRDNGDEVAGASGDTEQQGASEGAQAATNNGLPPSDDMPFKMSTAPAKSPQAAAKPQPPQQASAKQQPPARPAPAAVVSPARWAFLIGKHPRLVTADGSKLNLSIQDGALARELKRPDGSIAKDSLVFVSETSGAVRNEKGDAIATFETRNRGITIDYSDGSSETVSADARGLTSVADTKGGKPIATRWYPSGHRFSLAERKRAARQLAARLAAERIAAAKAARSAKQEGRVATAPQVQRAQKEETRVAQAQPQASDPSPPKKHATRVANASPNEPAAARSVIQPMPKPESIAAATDLPAPAFKPELHIAARQHKRHAEPPVEVAAVPAPSQPQTTVRESPSHEAAPQQAPSRVSPAHEAEVATAHASQKPQAPAAVGQETKTASSHESPSRASPAHPAAVREARAAPHEQQTPDAASAKIRESQAPATHTAPAATRVASVVPPAPQPPVAHPAPRAEHVASVALPAPQLPAPHAAAIVAPTPAVRAASAPPRAPVRVAATNSAAAPQVAHATTKAPPVVHAATPTQPTAAATHVAIAAPAAPAGHAATAAPPAVRTAAATAPSNAPVAQVGQPAPLAAAAARATPPPAPTQAVAHATVPPPPTQAVVHVTAPSLPTPAVEHLTVAPQQTAPAASHVAEALPPPTHTLLPQTSQPTASRRSASECLSIVSNGTHWGFRNNCDNDIQFAYCIMNGSDRLTACGDSAVPGSVAGHGFTSLVADLSMREAGANRSFRWVGCNGGAGEVVPRLDRADPPMGRCLHTSDLPQGAERADAGKKLAK